MLCKTPQELLERVRAEAGGANAVLASDNPAARLVGFCLEYPDRSVQHSVAVSALKEWEPPCPELKRMFLTADGKRGLALAMEEGRPFHEGCPQCLASHVMES